MGGGTSVRKNTCFARSGFSPAMRLNGANSSLFWTGILGLRGCYQPQNSSFGTMFRRVGGIKLSVGPITLLMRVLGNPWIQTSIIGQWPR